LLLCGERNRDHFQIEALGQKVPLVNSALHALIELIIARGTRATGFTPISRVTIRRLRQAMACTQASRAATLIETGCGEEYRLTLPKETLAREIAIAPSFFELTSIGAISHEQAEQLARIGRIVKPGRTRKPTRRKPR
jgi:hypothetical protein